MLASLIRMYHLLTFRNKSDIGIVIIHSRGIAFLKLVTHLNLRLKALLIDLTNCKLERH